MSEEEARAAIAARGNVPRETLVRIEAFISFLRQQAQKQNLISRSTEEHIWSRHVLDSAQLLDHAPLSASTWIDVGSGPGFPGLVIAALSDWHVTLVESRRMRVEFLTEAARLLRVENRTTIEGRPLERVPDAKHAVISARAFAPLPRLLDLAHRFSQPESVWILPKGRNAATELEAVRGTWQGRFRIEPSLTDPESAIIVADHIQRRSAR